MNIGAYIKTTIKFLSYTPEKKKPYIPNVIKFFGM